MTEISRRQFLAASGVAAASIWITAEARDLLASSKHAATANRFQVLSDADGADLEAAMAQIIPTDETPGAREARVVYFVDHGLATFAKDQRATFEKGAKTLRTRASKVSRGAKSFAELTSAQQIAVLTAMEKDKDPFFPQLRAATVTGMLANPEYGGNADKTGWKMIGFIDQFSWQSPFGWYDRNA